MRLSELRVKVRGVACAVAIAGLLAGCGGSSSSTASAPTGGSGTPTIQGVATPSSVSVVTAN